METNEPDEQLESEHLPELILDNDAKYFLYEIGKWAKFLGIAGFILTGFMVFAVIAVIFLFHSIPQMQPPLNFHQPQPPLYFHQTHPRLNSSQAFSRHFGLIGIIYITMAVLHFFCSRYLYQFSNRIKNAILSNDAVKVNSALEKLYGFFKLSGVAVIIVLLIYFITIIVIIGAGIVLFNRFH